MDKELHRIVVTVVIYKPDFTYFIAKRALNKKVMPGKWALPGGGLSTDDYINTPPSTEGAKQWYGALQLALRREVREEVGLEIKNVKYLTNLTFIRPDNIPVFVLSMIADYSSGQIILSSELVEYAWVDLKEAKKYDFISGIYEEIEMASLYLKGKPITTWKDHKNMR